MKKCLHCGEAVQEWIRPEPGNPENIAAIKAIELMGTCVHHPPHVCPICKHYWWFNENLIEDEPWPDDW